MPFEPLKLESSRPSALTIDKYFRLSISSSAKKELKLQSYQYVVISVDVENKRIGVAKQELAKVPNASSVKLDKRGYFGTKAGKEIVKKLMLTEKGIPAKFVDIGWIDSDGTRWRAFELVNPAE